MKLAYVYMEESSGTGFLIVELPENLKESIESYSHFSNAITEMVGL